MNERDRALSSDVVAEDARRAAALAAALALTPAAADALRALAEALETAGLAAFLAAFPPHSTRRERWRREVDALDPKLRALALLFTFGEPVAASALAQAVRGGLEPLAELGLAEVGDEARLRGVVLARPLGTWLLAEPEALVVDHYFGPDSIALAGHATFRAGSTCLDLCAGPGFQGLVALGRCRRALLVELQPTTAQLALVNLALNGVAGRAEVRCGDLYGPVGDDVFDHVVANVPFIPVPPGCAFPIAGAGGEDGFDVGRRVLAGLRAHLGRDGSAHLAALLLRGDTGLLVAEELEAWARANECALRVTLTARLPVDLDSPLVRATAAAIAMSGGREADAALAVAANYARHGARSAAWAFLRVDARGRGDLRVLDLASPNRPGPWISVG